MQMSLRGKVLVLMAEDLRLEDNLAFPSHRTLTAMDWPSCASFPKREAGHSAPNTDARLKTQLSVA